MNFGEAMILAREGKRIARRGWNGKGMYIYFVRGRTVPVDDWKACDEAQEPTDHERLTGFVTILPHLDMYSAQGTRVIGWLASQTDMLSDDWEIVS